MTEAHLRHEDGTVTHHRYEGPARGPAVSGPIVGAVVDGAFVSAGSPVRCRGGPRVLCSGGRERDVPFPSRATAESAAQSISRFDGIPDRGSLAALAAGRRPVARLEDLSLIHI